MRETWSTDLYADARSREQSDERALGRILIGIAGNKPRWVVLREPMLIWHACVGCGERHQ
jgi:hypothetical protein